MPPEVLRGVGRSDRNLWPRFLALPAHWLMSMSPWVFESSLRVLGGLGVPG